MNHYSLANAPRPHQHDCPTHRPRFQEREKEIDVGAWLPRFVGLADGLIFIPPWVLQVDPSNDVLLRNRLHRSSLPLYCIRVNALTLVENIIPNCLISCCYEGD